MEIIVILLCISGLHAWDMVLTGPSSVGIGETMSLTCNATGLESNSSWSTEWFKGYDKLYPSEKISMTSEAASSSITGTLKVADMMVNDAGKYKCWLSNKMIRQITVTVGEHPKTGADSGAAGKDLSTTSTLLLYLLMLCLSFRIYT